MMLRGWCALWAELEVASACKRQKLNFTAITKSAMVFDVFNAKKTTLSTVAWILSLSHTYARTADKEKRLSHWLWNLMKIGYQARCTS